MHNCSKCDIEIEIDDELTEDEIANVDLFCKECYSKHLLETSKNGEVLIPLNSSKNLLH